MASELRGEVFVHSLGRGRLHLEPLVLEGLLGSQALLGLHNQEAADEVFGLVGDVVPVRTVEFKLSRHNGFE